MTGPEIKPMGHAGPAGQAGRTSQAGQAAMTGDMVVRGHDLVRRHGTSEVVRGLSIAIGAGESVALLGPSGCGKTTLLQMLGLLDRPDSGQVLLGGTDVWALSARERASLRSRHIGFVFQRHNLIEHMSARDNVALAAWHAGTPRRRSLAAADALLERFGLSERAGAAAAVLSPGESQRVAIARAMINEPGVVLADEPTGSLDSRAAAVVLDALAAACAAGAALLVVTHSRDVAESGSRRVTMKDGRLHDSA
jgi:putative ABC transport system ATP-binding protein